MWFCWFYILIISLFQNKSIWRPQDQLHQNLICACVCVYSGLLLLSTSFQSYRHGVWLRQGAQCSLLKCCLTEVSCRRHLTYHNHSHYPDIGPKSPSSTLLSWYVARLGSNPVPSDPQSGTLPTYRGRSSEIYRSCLKPLVLDQQNSGYLEISCNAQPSSGPRP